MKFEMHYISENNIKDTVILFKGDLEDGVLETLVNDLELKLKVLNMSNTTVKRIMFIAIELLQNVIRYGYTGDKKYASCVLKVEYDEKGFHINCQNAVAFPHTSLLDNHLKEINARDVDQLKELYLTALSNGKFSKKGGAGLGFLSIAMKAKNKFNFQIMKINELYAWYGFGISVQP